MTRTFLFDTSFELRDEHGTPYAWTPCREAALEEPQSEGVDAGRFMEADLEGLSAIAGIPGRTLLLASSQGDSRFHFYEISREGAAHRGVFFIEGVGETDGVHYVHVPLGHQFPLGLLVVQNGEAPEPPDTGDVNGYEFDGSTQFMYVNFREALRALRN